MATYIQQLAAKTDPLRLVVAQGGKLAPRKLVPTHIEQLISYKPGRPPEQLKNAKDAAKRLLAEMERLAQA